MVFARLEFGSALGTLFGTGGNANQIIPSIGSVFSINDAGEIVGSRWLYPNFLQGRSERIDLGTLGGRLAAARSINGNGYIVGSADINSSGHSRAVLFSRTAGNDGNVGLGTLGGNYATAYSINNSGQVVGMSFLEGDSVQAGFLLQNGVIYNLNDLVDPSQGVTNIGVGSYDRSINHFGQIAAFGTVNGQTRALLLNPLAPVSNTTVGESGEVIQTLRLTPDASYATVAEVSNDGTTVALLGGISGSGGEGAFGLNREVRIAAAGTDPGSFVGTTIELTGTERDTFVLSMSYDPGAFADLCGQAATPVLGWMDGTAWVTAIGGNDGGTANFVNGPWMDAYSLGTYGIDTQTNSVWAVVNHNSLFAVIPFEPVVPPGNGYWQWMAGFLNPEQMEDPEFTGMDKDPDKDGLSNLLEYAFNL